MKYTILIHICIYFKLAVISKLTNHSLLWTNMQYTSSVTDKLVYSYRSGKIKINKTSLKREDSKKLRKAADHLQNTEFGQIRREKFMQQY